MSMKTGTLFHCMLGDSGRVDWEVYERVDLTELEYRGIRHLLSQYVYGFVQFVLHSFVYLPSCPGGIMHGHPADNSEDHIWI